MSASNGLAEGQRLTIPAGVIRSHHNATTFKPFDSSETLGDISPTTPTSQKTVAKRGGKCGIFGMILLVVIAVAVSVVTYGALTGPATGILGAMGAGAVSGAAGSIVSQAFGVATGIQDKFSWKGVAMAAISGAVGGGLGKVGGFLGADKLLSHVAKGALSSALSQGIGVATGLQKKFDWVGVAAAGIGAGAGHAAGQWLGPRLGGIQSGFARNLAFGFGTNMAEGIASAAARSLISGTDFGDNMIRQLPSIIGSTIGNAIGFEIDEAMERAAQRREAAVIAGPPIQLASASDDLAGLGQRNRVVVAGEGAPLLICNTGNCPGRMVTAEQFRGEAEDSTAHTIFHMVATSLEMDPHSVTDAQNAELVPHIDRFIRILNEQNTSGTISQGGLERAQAAWFARTRPPVPSGPGIGDAIISGLQSGADAVTNFITRNSDAALQAYRNSTAGLENVPGAQGSVLAGDFVTSGLNTVINGIGSIPSAIAHPLQSLEGTARWLDSIFLDDRPARVVVGQNYQALRNSSARQIAQGGGHFAGGVALTVAPTRFAPRAQFRGTLAFAPSLDLRPYSRPSNFRVGVRDKVWNNAAAAGGGVVRDPETGRIMSRSDPWDMGHLPGHEFRRMQREAARLGISRAEFLDWHNNPSIYRPELPSSNRGHRLEDHSPLF